MKLPPMNALRAFEAVSRHLSVSKAAEELCVSQGAVSQQIHNLEDYLGRELFVRSHYSFRLTDEGEGFAIVVQQALTDIAHAASDVTRARFSYYFVSPPNARPNPALIAFRDWLVMQTKKYRAVHQ